METKICRTCGQPKSLDEFSSTLRVRTKVPSHLSYSLDCRPCASTKSAGRQRENWEHVRAYRDNDGYRRSQKNGWLLKTYHRTIDWYEEQFAKQGGVCAICGKPEHCKTTKGNIKSLAVDHDHACCSGKVSCGKCVRGLICTMCNHALGRVSDDIEILAAAILYVNSFKKDTLK